MFITFEGIDYTGKSTQAKLLYDYLKSRKQKALLLREPGGTRISEKIREILLSKVHLEMNLTTEYLLFSAARAQLVNEIIEPALKKGITVICDRYYDSSTAYQGFGAGMSIQEILRINDFATGGLAPDLTFLFNISPKKAFERHALRKNKKDRMEIKNTGFYNRVYRGFLEIANKNKKRFVVIDGTQSVDEIHDAIIKKVNNKIKLYKNA